MASAYLTRTPSSSGNLRTFTFSAWFKKATTNAGYLFGAGDMSDGDPSVAIEAGENIQFRVYAGGHISRLVPTQKARDNSAWYHYVVAVDTTQATASNRVKVYINGSQVTDFSTEEYMTQNYDTVVNSSSYAQRVGDRGGGNFDGLMTHVHLIDGTQYQASDFGETDSTSGIWKPKTQPSVTYGTNGFFLKMENSSDFGEDSSGNNNDFTTSGTITQAEDTPSNVFATMNPLAMGTASSNHAFSNGNLTSTNSSSGHRSVVSSLAVSSGKWYFEGKSVTTGGAYPTFGIFNADASFDAGTYFTSTANGYGYNSNGDIFNNNGSIVTGLATWTDGDIIGVALDATNNKIYFSKNGSWQNSADPSAGTGGQSITSDITWYFAGHTNDGGTDPVQNYNFGNGYFGTTAVASSNSDGAGLGLFEYSVPTGYYSLCTKNIKNYG